MLLGLSSDVSHIHVGSSKSALTHRSASLESASNLDSLHHCVVLLSIFLWSMYDGWYRQYKIDRVTDYFLGVFALSFSFTSRIRKVNLWFDLLFGDDDHCICASGFSNLTYLSFTKCVSVTAEAMESLSSLDKLVKLDFERCPQIHGGFVHLQGWLLANNLSFSITRFYRDLGNDQAYGGAGQIWMSAYPFMWMQ